MYSSRITVQSVGRRCWRGVPGTAPSQKSATMVCRLECWKWPKLTRHQAEQLSLCLAASCGAPHALRDWACCAPLLGQHADQRVNGADSPRAQGGLQRLGAVLKDKVEQLLPHSQVPRTACTSAMLMFADY